MSVFYTSTRGGGEEVPAGKAVLTGLAPDGGLYVPDHFPALPGTLRDLAELNYQQLACRIIGEYFTDFTDEEIGSCVSCAYDDKFDEECIVPLAKADGAFYAELYHGPTLAFKDLALSVLPHLMRAAMKKYGDGRECVILTATSGDTGKAAMAGFADVPGTKIIVFYPKDGVSAVQRQQMVTQTGKNVCAVAVDGNFDDCQTGVKTMLSDDGLKRELAGAGLLFSSANSINIGRLVPQIVYYVYAYTRLLKEGEIDDGGQVNIAVPTGNFGNILAAYYAKEMGLPVKTLICASNENNVLYDFFTTGIYDRNRPFTVTSSPSMDILVSSNLERLLYHVSGGNAEATAERMKSLAETGVYPVTDKMREKMDIFAAGWADEETVARRIRDLFSSCGYLIDTHTAVASAVVNEYRKSTGDGTATLIASTASPYKFAPAIAAALTGNGGREDTGSLTEAFCCVDEVNRLTGLPVPPAVQTLKSAPVLHTGVSSVPGLADTVREILRV